VSTGGVVAIAIFGIVVGWFLAVMVVRRQIPDLPDTAVPHDPLARAVLSETRTGYAVLDGQGHVLLANARAAELGVVRAGFADARVNEAAERTLVSGEPVDVDLTDRGARNGPTMVHAEVRLISDDTVLVIAADESAAAKVEAVRRDFVANVSHELKTPIGSVLLLAEALQDAADEPEMVRYFAGKITHESNRLATLVSELIALSKLQGAAESIELVPVSIDAVLDEVLNRTATIAAAAGTSVGLAGTPGLVVMGERTLLITAISNLVENAIHHSPEQTPVTIDRRFRDGLVQIAVADRGTGIPVNQQERVFERFFRGDPARSRQTGGTGLGLAIVKHVAARHGGEVTLWSRVGTGSTFTVKMPPAPATTGGATVPEHAQAGTYGAPESPGMAGAAGLRNGARSGVSPSSTSRSLSPDKSPSVTPLTVELTGDENRR
jgi:two-component system, OmpR family, sensor histidine kinase SenX3